ncbi:MAG: Hpt domain-containing protein, partial [Pseudanabaena sp. ELA748]
MFEQLDNNAIAKLLDHPEFVILPTLDLAAFQDLRETIGDDGAFCDLVTIYFNSAETLIDTIQLALTNQDADKFTLAAHSLKSTSASIGASRLSRICK